MRPTTKFILAMRLPGQATCAHEALCEKGFDSRDMNDGNLMIEESTIVETAKAMVVVLSTVTHTKTLAFGICRSKEDAEKFFTLRAKSSSTTDTDSMDLTLDSFLNEYLELNPQTPETLIFTDPDVTNSEYGEAFESPEMKLVRSLREPEDRHLIPLPELIRQANMYVQRFPLIACHDPRWDGQPIAEWLKNHTDVDTHAGEAQDKAEPLLHNLTSLPMTERASDSEHTETAPMALSSESTASPIFPSRSPKSILALLGK
jgi:hypothetical protein